MIVPIPVMDLWFPHPSNADPNGLLGVGGDLSPERLELAYRMGIFPWYSDPQPILWWSPNPRMVLPTHELRVPRSLAKRIRQQRFEIKFDTAFSEVVRRCGITPRPGQESTWITDEMHAGYVGLFERGLAHSIEAWADGSLVGGLYGVAVGRLFAGESMFADRPDASKVAFVHLVRQLIRWGFPLVDCQVYTQHLERFGAREVSRQEYLTQIARLVDEEGRPGPWTFDPDFECRG
ncbi:MAG: leucyl/phenylalanyl-tRNA--protein transferase [Myxococcota bacterium]